MTSAFTEVLAARAAGPGAIESALRTRRPFAGEAWGPRQVVVIAADHPARGAFRAGDHPWAMADRGALLERIVRALGRPGVAGFLGSADLVEDLALLGALDGKLVFGTMNRGGLLGARFEADDRFTAYDAAGVAAAGLDGGKMLLRLDDDDPGSLRTLEACGRAVSALAAHGRIAMVEPFVARRTGDALRNDLSTDAVVRSVAIASALGNTSACTWLKVPVADDMARVAQATTVPLLVLGGEVPRDADATLRRWSEALAQPTVKGLVIGRALLFPRDGDVERAVDLAVSLVRK